MVLLPKRNLEEEERNFFFTVAPSSPTFYIVDASTSLNIGITCRGKYAAPRVPPLKSLGLY